MQENRSFDEHSVFSRRGASPSPALGVAAPGTGHPARHGRVQRSASSSAPDSTSASTRRRFSLPYSPSSYCSGPSAAHSVRWCGASRRFVDQNYVRAETHAAANARLIDYQSGIGLAQAWGGGLVASVDGLRFVVPVATINAGPNPHYFSCAAAPPG